MESQHHRKRKNNNKQDKTNQNKETTKPIELSEEDKLKEKFMQIKIDLENLKKIIIGEELTNNDPNIEMYDKFFNYNKFNLLNFNEIKNKILSIFNTDKIDIIFLFLFDILNLVIEFYLKNNEKTQKNKKEAEENNDEETQEDENEKKENNENENSENKINDKVKNEEEEEVDLSDEKSVYNKCFQLFKIINFFISPNLIINSDNELKEKTTLFLENNLFKIKKMYCGSSNFLYLYINIFDKKEKLLNIINDEQNTNSQIKSSLIDDDIYLNLIIINALNLQNKYTLDIIFKKISDNYIIIGPPLYTLLKQVYPNKENEIINHFYSLLEMKKSILISYNLLYKLLHEDYKNNEEFKNNILNMIKKYMMIPYDRRKLYDQNIYDVSYYCKIIFENENYFPEDEATKAKQYICNYFNSMKFKDFKKNYIYLKIFEKKELGNFLDVKFFYDLLYQTKQIQNICTILKFIPKETKKYLDWCSNIKISFKIVKILNLSQGEYPYFLDEEKLYPFFTYKINECKETNNPTSLIDYALISQDTYSTAITIILKNYKPKMEEKDFYLYVMNELYYAPKNIKYIKLGKHQKTKIDKIFRDINYDDKYSFNDYYGPVTKNCYTINMNETKIEFVYSMKNLKNICKDYYSNTKFIGIDTEWRQNLSANEKEEVSIMQLCDYEQKCCLILDIAKLKHKKKFFNEFTNIFEGKTFLGYSFNKNDLLNMPIEMREFFETKCQIYDLRTIYQQKYLEKASSLKVMFETLEKIPLCKYEQCSDWELRPLRKTQLHYAALDALACVLLYKNLMEIK